MRQTPTYAVSTWAFLRLLGVVYLVAFWSLETQIPGLAGSHGIAPAHELMADAARWADSGGLGLARYLQWPTVFWLGVQDRWLTGLCLLGTVLSLPLIAGIGGALVLPILWVLYLSLATVTGDFLAFQWDSLLLETGVIAMAVAPWRLVERPGHDAPPPLARWLLWWLLFRLMFASGVVKLTSGDPLWRGLTALVVHFETQPLPTPLGWWAHHGPLWLQSASTAAVLGLELVVPWCIAGRPPWRRTAAILFVTLQLLIAATGNYAFFNLLAAALALTLVDDAATARLMRVCGLRMSVPGAPPARARWQWVPAAVLWLVVLPVSADILASQMRLTLPGANWARTAREWLLPLRSINAYGLFAVMTSTRPEITIEGSQDGTAWRAYTFHFKPGDPATRPAWVAPHQPRLDWQMWFAALGDAGESPWFERFCERLLEGSPPVLALLADAPFSDTPPRYVRATLARYRMATLQEHRTEGVWWTRGAPRVFLGPLGGGTPR